MKTETTVFAILLVLLLPFSTAKAAEEKASHSQIADLEERVQTLEELVLELQSKLAAKDTSRSVDGASAARSTQQQLASKTAVPAQAAGTINQSDPGGLAASWREGLRFDSEDRQFSFKIGGRLMNDWAFGTAGQDLEDEVGPFRDGTEFRRARINLEGTFYGSMFYKAEYDFAGLTPDFKDVYIGIQDLPGIGSFRIGHQKEAFGLEELTSSRHITFMERSLANVFSPSRNTGVQFQNSIADERATWAAGVFRTSLDNALAVNDGGYNLTTRFTALPWYSDGGRKLWHLGIAYSRHNTLLDRVLFRERPEVHLSNRFVNTGLLPGNSYDLLGWEGAVVVGPFSLQGEHSSAFVNAPQVSDPVFSGAYIQASFFLTGENRRYQTGSGVFDRIRPQRVLFGDDGGAGAWELATRYSWLDLNDAQVQGGELKNFTLGLNWYLNSNARMMWNYVNSDLVSSGTANIFQTRFQVDF